MPPSRSRSLVVFAKGLVFGLRIREFLASIVDGWGGDLRVRERLSAIMEGQGVNLYICREESAFMKGKIYDSLCSWGSNHVREE